MENPGTGQPPKDGYDWTMHKIQGMFIILNLIRLALKIFCRFKLSIMRMYFSTLDDFRDEMAQAIRSSLQ